MNSEPQQPADRPPHSVLRFRLRTLMLFVTVVAAAFGLTHGLDLDPSVPFFIIGFGALLALMTGMMVNSSDTSAVVYETDSIDEAVLLCAYLSEHEMKVLVREGQLPGFTGLNMHLHQIVVRSDQLEYARQLIEEKLDSVSESRL
jgi:hypothetical protein